MARTLTAYRAKRDFEKTAEPAGDKVLQPAEYPRFVIHKHDATRLHYDFRLELDGVFKSWAVTRGPSLDPGEKRLAVEVEDHPLDYGDFEGTIPKGQYGGGTVMLWDRGFWSPIGTSSAEKALSAGELKFTLAGSKLNGSWVLVRMKNDRTGGKRTNWLLIKHRDEWAKTDDNDTILKKDRSVGSGRTMLQIAKGAGDGPQPFMLGGGQPAKPDAIWNSAATPPPKPSARPIDQEMGPPPKIVAVVSTGNKVQGIALSSPDKELWPKTTREAITKRDLVEYLASVGPWMLQHIKGRPCSLVRAPDGVDHKTFFQRHAMAGTSDHVETVKLDGDHEPYVQLNTVEAVVAMGQFAAVEFHPWNCAPFAPTVPGRLIFDLDPAPDVPFPLVVEAAKELRERLEALGLVAFCKTTGGKGLHVVTPLDTRDGDTLGWDEAKMFAQAVCVHMAKDQPARYLTKMTKNLRNGRIYLDYLRNDRIATAVAPLSPRARPGAPVSMPLTWAQVRTDLDPQRFTIHTAVPLLAKSVAWKEYHTSARLLRPAIETLIGAR
jgi:bifunctional non-homologous end joining protein LigD